MNGTSRRKLLKMLFAAAVIPAVVSREAAATVSGGLITPPPGTMRFRRTIVRQLSGDARISVTRDFAISFQRFADGFIVKGRQVAVEVSAPANLTAFVDLERARVETAMFPITLDPFGQIISEGTSAGCVEEVNLAFDEALEQIASQQLDSGERGELQQFVAALHHAGNLLIVAMPSDLFAPAATGHGEDRTVPLPSGDVGHVTSRFDAERDDRTGLMRRALREVVTEIEGDRRHTIEHWQLTRN